MEYRGPGIEKEEDEAEGRSSSFEVDVTDAQLEDAYNQHVDPSTFEKSELLEVAIKDLHPTQIAVGMQQVWEKRQRVAKLAAKKKGEKKVKEFMKEHPIPVVLGPGGVMYLIDHHHLGCALIAEGVEETYATLVLSAENIRHSGSLRRKHTSLWFFPQKTYVTLVLDLSQYTIQDFWREMMSRNFIWPYDENGDRLGEEGEPGDLPPKEFINHLPSSLTGMKDDPYRSLAGLVRKAGGFEKNWAPFAEFKWANHFRSRVQISDEQPPDHPEVMSTALRHAAGSEALQAGLPGFLGVKGPATA